jgi:hypothetical protein
MYTLCGNTLCHAVAQIDAQCLQVLHESGLLGKLIDLLSSLSLSKSEAGSGNVRNVDQLCAGQEQRVEFTLAALRFLEVMSTSF